MLFFKLCVFFEHRLKVHELLSLYQEFSSETVVGSSRPIVSGRTNKERVTNKFKLANTAAGPHGTM